MLVGWIEILSPTQPTNTNPYSLPYSLTNSLYKNTQERNKNKIHTQAHIQKRVPHMIVQIPLNASIYTHKTLQVAPKFSVSCSKACSFFWSWCFLTNSSYAFDRMNRRSSLIAMTSIQRSGTPTAILCNTPMYPSIQMDSNIRIRTAVTKPVAKLYTR